MSTRAIDGVWYRFRKGPGLERKINRHLYREEGQGQMGHTGIALSSRSGSIGLIDFGRGPVTG